MNYYAHHIGDYLRDTLHLTMLEHGAYRRMLDLYYSSEKPLSLDESWLFRLVRAERQEEQSAVRFVLQHFFEKYEDGYRNKRADQEIKIAERKAKAARTNGKKGGRPKTQSVSRGLAKPNPEITQGKAPNNQEPIANNQRKETGAFALPAWVPEDAWKGWLEVRQKIKAPNTHRALAIAVKDLDRLRGEGQDPLLVLETATVKGWRGLFPVGKGTAPLKVDL